MTTIDHRTLAAKHAERLRAEIAVCGCPRAEPRFHSGSASPFLLWCSACVDRDQIAGELEQLDGVREAAKALIAKIDETLPHVTSLFALQFARTGRQYTGPNFAQELAALRALVDALDRRCPRCNRSDAVTVFPKTDPEAAGAAECRRCNCTF